MLLHMTDIPTVNYSSKLFLQQELSLPNCLTSLSLMLEILLLTIYLIDLNCLTRNLTLLWQLLNCVIHIYTTIYLLFSVYTVLSLRFTSV